MLQLEEDEELHSSKSLKIEAVASSSVPSSPQTAASQTHVTPAPASPPVKCVPLPMAQVAATRRYRRP